VAGSTENLALVALHKYDDVGMRKRKHPKNGLIGTFDKDDVLIMARCEIHGGVHPSWWMDGCPYCLQKGLEEKTTEKPPIGKYLS
jgi:hypothetical protein